MIIDRLVDRVEERGPVCVGLDSGWNVIPESFKKEYKTVEETLFQFNKRIIDCTEDICAIYKPQIAFYEAQGLEGLTAYARTLAYLREKGLLSIADVKRGDIASTAEQYAKAHFEGTFEADFMTLNPYMGYDSITPYFPYLEKGTKGVFVLLRTSNPGAKDIEYLNVDGEALYYKVGDNLEKMGRAFIGERGYSALCMVTGGTQVEEVTEIRNRYPQSFFLIPGYGAQGGKADNVRLYLKGNNGGIVNASRSIIKAWANVEDGEARFEEVTRQAVLNMREDIYGGQWLS